jgi:hypothetical protein
MSTQSLFKFIARSVSRRVSNPVSPASSELNRDRNRPPRLLSRIRHPPVGLSNNIDTRVALAVHPELQRFSGKANQLHT